MNDQDKAKRRNDIARLFRHSSKIHRNCIRLNSGNTLVHEMKKVELCWNFLKAGIEFICEAELEGRIGRADIVDLDEGTIIEIVQTESEESIADKRKRYPLPIVVVRA